MINLGEIFIQISLSHYVGLHVLHGQVFLKFAAGNWATENTV